MISGRTGLILTVVPTIVTSFPIDPAFSIRIRVMPSGLFTSCTMTFPGFPLWENEKKGARIGRIG